MTSVAKQRATITDRALDASAVCSNGLTCIPKKGESKVKEKGQ